MADISTDFLGIKSPNPFWLASAPPTDKLIKVYKLLNCADLQVGATFILPYGL